ncbi:MAG: exo-alpha-sialidase, partial [Niabella sp.]
MPMFKLIALLFSTLFLLSCNSNKEYNVKVIETPAGDSSMAPFLFADEKDLLHFSWIEKKGKFAILKHSSFENRKWSDAKKIASGENWFVNWADFPSICADGKNNLIAHYLEKSDSGKFTYDVKYVLSSDNGNTWSAPQILNKDGKLAEHGFVSIKPYKENYFMSWLDGRNTVTDHSHAGHAMHQGEMTLRATIIKKDGTVLDEWQLDSRVCDCCQTSVAITDNGPVVVYRDRSADEIRDIY